MLNAAILAGGQATRLYPFTRNLPKSLIEINNVPFISHQLDFLRYQGVSSVVLCLGNLGHLIQQYVGDGSKWCLKVTYSFDGSEELGTGGAIQKALPLLGDNFFLMYGDLYPQISLASVINCYDKSNKKALMVIYKNEDKIDKSNIIYDTGKIKLYDKNNYDSSMKYVDYGLSILSKNIFKKYRNSISFDIAKIYKRLSILGELEGYEAYQRPYEIGSFRGIEEAELFLLGKIK